MKYYVNLTPVILANLTIKLDVPLQIIKHFKIRSIFVVLVKNKMLFLLQKCYALLEVLIFAPQTHP